MIKIYECKLCGFQGARHIVRKHVRESHLWKTKKLSKTIKSKRFN